MQLNVERTLFTKALSHGQNVVERRTTVPILGNILLECNVAGLHLTTTDTEMSLIETIPANIIQSGSTTVSAHMLHDIVRKLQGDDLSLDLQENGLHIRSGRSHFRLSCLPQEDFPRLQQLDLPFSFEITSKELLELIDRTRFAMSHEETRYYLNGIYFHPASKDDKCYWRAVATDGHRLAYHDSTVPVAADMPGVIVSRKTIIELRKLLEDEETNVTIKLSQVQIQFCIGNATLTSRLIDGQFPQYEQVIPQNLDKKLIVPTKEFASAIDRVAIIAADKVRVVTLTLKDDNLTLSASSQELGQGQEEMQVDFPYAEKTLIGFNPRYLLDVTDCINEDEVVINLSHANSPVMIQGNQQKNTLYVLMPMLV